MNQDWKKAVADEWSRRALARPTKTEHFPLIEQNFDTDEITEMVEVLLSGQLTMANRVRAFERQFAEFVGAPYAVMVNSGSSANLLAMAVASNIQRSSRLCSGDEVLIPAVCWSTSVWPVIQMGLRPIFVDVDPNTLNISIGDMKRKIGPKTKGLVAVHILGNSAPMKDMLELSRKYNLIIIEDTCESLGSRYGARNLGAYGDFGTYSFYYSHHITSGEGGMVVCQTQDDYDLLKCLRAHGWSRELSNRQDLEAKYDNVDPRFLFVNTGYNLRPMEIQAALGSKQLGKIGRMNQNRVQNRERLVQAMRSHPRWNGQFEFTQAAEGTTPVWFGFCALLKQEFENQLKPFLKYLSESGVENRPIVSGNFTRQPGLKLMGFQLKPEDYQGAEAIHRRGFFIGLHTEALSDSQVQRLAHILLSYPGFN